MLTIDNKQHNTYSNPQTFKGGNPYNALQGGLKLADLFIKSQENLSSTRFIQDTATNWFPKAVFARSKADFAEMTFLEFLESGIFYFAPPILGEKLFRNGIFKNVAPKNLKNSINQQIPKSIKEIEANSNITKNVKDMAISTKAGILLACTAIPVAEFVLSFAKNLFTLKTFKKCNFNSIAKLNKNSDTEVEDKEQQQRVEKNSKKELKRGAIISLAGIALGILLAKNGHKSEKLQKISKTILEPGVTISNGLGKLGVKNEKLKNTVSKFSLDFSNNNGKLALSKGQLALTAILGLFGYSKAAKDRGKLDVAEVWTRVPIVVFYTIFGGELFEKAFIKRLSKGDKFKELLQKDNLGNIKIPSRDELPKLAENIAKLNKTNSLDEFKKLVKQKAIAMGIPYAFSLLFMGFTLSAVSRFWTQYRYNKQNKEKENKNQNQSI